MSTEIVHQPTELTFETFHEIDVECFPGEPAGREMFEAVLAADFWAVQREGRLIGYGFLKINDDTAWISRVGIAATDRNRGIGHRLMEAMLDRCRRLARLDVLLYVDQDNPAAIHLYEKFGFRVAEESWQYVVDVPRFFAGREAGTRGGVTARPVVDVSRADRPDFSGQWAGLAEQHDPPKTHVLLFFAGEEERIGHCRLAPDFPGCFPIVVSDPGENLAAVLDALRPLLSPEHDSLRLLIADADLAGVCAALGFRLNYGLYKMTNDLRVQEA